MSGQKQQLFHEQFQIFLGESFGLWYRHIVYSAKQPRYAYFWNISSINLAGAVYR